MVDFKKLKSQKESSKSIDPVEIFRRLPKPEGINDLYSSQTEILSQWFEKRNDQDVVVKLHTGGGKTLVGLLMAVSTQYETGEPVLYLAPTKQLVQQTLDKAAELGIKAVPYESGKPFNSDFENGRAIMIATYRALFNGRSKFGLRGGVNPLNLGAVILDDAHAAFSVIRDSFTFKVDSKKNYASYNSLVDLFRNSFKEIDKLGTLEDVTSGSDYSILEVPYWAWNEQLDAVREVLKNNHEDYNLEWPLIRDQLNLCHALISKDSFTITPILPTLNIFPSFHEAPRRIYMSATIADDSELIRTFNVSSESINKALKSRSLAGISERMILIPELMPFEYKVEWDELIMKWFSEKKKVGTVVLVSSDDKAEKWKDKAIIAKGSIEVESLVSKLQEKSITGPVVFSNRYDGIDLPGDSCRVLLMSGLPSGTSNYELFRASILHGGTTITRMLAQRIEQGIGRGARGAGDHCVILLTGKDISSWVAKEANFKFLTSATKAQLDMGIEISKEITTPKDLIETINMSIDRNKDWVEYHANSLASMMDGNHSDDSNLDLALMERKAVDLWNDGYYEKAIVKLEKAINKIENDSQLKGWLQQLSARIADNWGNKDRALDLQQQAFSNNRNLARPKIIPPYRPLNLPSSQARAIVKKIGGYRIRQGYLQNFEKVVSNLHADASNNVFEQALCDLARIIGLESERHDINGEGPDVLWLLPDKIGFVIEAKSRKKQKNPLTKGEHGQLLVASEWFAREYPDYECIKVSLHPQNIAHRTAIADSSFALTYEKLNALISDARAIIQKLCNSQLDSSSLEIECEHLLAKSNIRSNKLKEKYLESFN